jgi:hypothetical protein
MEVHPGPVNLQSGSILMHATLFYWTINHRMRSNKYDLKRDGRVAGTT